MSAPSNRRILLIDDMPSIHADFRKILAGPVATTELDAMEAQLFGTPIAAARISFAVDSAYQGQDGVDMVAHARASGLPYAMAFVDMRMPPGLDGAQTIELLWEQDPQVQIVICTAHSDYGWDELLARLAVRDRLLVLKKPFDSIEVCQLAVTLTEKWALARQAASTLDQLEEAVRLRTAQLERANETLLAEMAQRKQLESRLVQAEKLAGVGRLAAGVAHEINNPLSFLASNLGIFERYAAALLDLVAVHEEGLPDAAPEHAARIRSAAERHELDYLRRDLPELLAESRSGMLRVSKVVNDLREFSRPDAIHPWECVNLDDLVDITLRVMAGAIGSNVRIERDGARGPDIMCLPAQLNQVLMSLITNGIEAIGDGPGTLTVRTGTLNEQLWVEVADTGCGIAEHALPRIFDPFFTTKGIGKATGLGLSLAYGIVQMHQGSIEVVSAPGAGSIFRMLLPARSLTPAQQ